MKILNIEEVFFVVYYSVSHNNLFFFQQIQLKVELNQVSIFNPIVLIKDG